MRVELLRKYQGCDALPPHHMRRAGLRGCGRSLILMNGPGDRSNVNYWNAVKQCVFNHPLIEPGAPDRQRGHLGIYVASKYKSIDGSVMAGNTGRQNLKLQRSVRIEIQIISKINLPAMSDGKKFRNLFVDSHDGVLKFLQRNNVAIYVAQHGSLGHPFSPLNKVVKQRSAKIVPLDISEMADLQFGCDLCGALFFTEEKNFRTRIK